MKLKQNPLLFAIASTGLLWTSLSFANPTISLDVRNSLGDNGTARVIIGLGLKDQWQPEGKISPANAQNQRAHIKNAQKDFIKTFNQALQQNGIPTIAASWTAKYVPYLGLEIDSSTLTYLEQNAVASTVHLDEPDVLSQQDNSRQQIGADIALEQGYAGSGQTIVVLDSGVDHTHPNLDNNMSQYGACYSSNYEPDSATTVCPDGSEVQQAEGAGINCDSEIKGCDHGTHVAGIALQTAPDIDLVSVQVFSQFGHDVGSYPSDQIKGLEYVYDLYQQGVSVAAVNMSLTSRFKNYKDPTRCDANHPSRKAIVDTLQSVGIATIAAAGNAGIKNKLSAPACISSVISVGATDPFGEMADYSNASTFLDLVAPGTGIQSTLPGGRRGAKDGTSMAAPAVAAAIAILKAQHPEATVEELVTVLKESGQLVDDYPMLHIAEALEQMRSGDANICTNITAISQAQCETLVALYERTDGKNWSNNAGWHDTNSPCDWEGITCNNGNITGLNLANNNLTGALPPLNTLKDLTFLRLDNNQLTGPLPSFNGLKKLQTLWLYYNQFTGPLPNLGGLPQLTDLSIHDNQLEGTLPDWLNQLDNLQQLHVQNNQFSGPIPNLATLTNLTDLWIDGNSEFCKMPMSDYGQWTTTVAEFPECPQEVKLCDGITDGLIACYQFENNALDGSGHGYHGTVNGATLTTDRFGNPDSAYSFDGQNNFIEVDRFDELTQNLTITVWINHDSLLPNTIAKGILGQSENNGSDAGFSLQLKETTGGNAKIRFAINDEIDGLTTIGTEDVKRNTWHFISVTYGGNHQKLYWNGDLVNLADNFGQIKQAQKALLIGTLNHGQAPYFSGKIDDVRIYNRVLSKAEIQTLYRLGQSDENTLTITKTGEGEITSTDNSILCGETCQADYEVDSSVTLTATPATGSTFTGWSGDCSNTSATTTVTMDVAKNCMALFEEDDPESFFPFVATSSKYGSSADINQACIDEFGNRYQLTDWNDIVAYYKSGASMSVFFEKLDMLPRAKNLRVSRNGNIFYRGTRQYFIQRHDHQVPSGWAVHANINSNLLDLGSWYGAMPVLCYGFPSLYDVTVNKTGAGRGIIKTRVNGTSDWTIDCQSDCQTANYEYAPDSEVYLRAYPEKGFVFSGWSGDCSGTKSNLTITIDGAKTCTAQFDIDPSQVMHLLTVNTVGDGAVEGKIGKKVYLDCGEDCSDHFKPGKKVTLTATPGANNLFMGWTGDCSGQSERARVTLDAAKTCTATFQAYNPDEIYPLTCNKIGDGRGKCRGKVTSEDWTLNCLSDCTSTTQDYAAGSNITLRALPLDGFIFKEWSGACNGTEASVTVPMDQAKACTAQFDLDPNETWYKLTVSTIGTGMGTVNNPGTLDCGDNCTADYYREGEEVRLKATPTSLSEFSGWTGNCEGTKTAKFTITQDMTCFAEFTSRLEITAAGIVEAFYKHAILENEQPVATQFPRTAENETRLTEAFWYALMVAIQETDLYYFNGKKWPSQLVDIDKLAGLQDENTHTKSIIIKARKYIEIVVELENNAGTAEEVGILLYYEVSDVDGGGGRDYTYFALFSRWAFF